MLFDTEFWEPEKNLARANEYQLKCSNSIHLTKAVKIQKLVKFTNKDDINTVSTHCKQNVQFTN
jgi:hypothetical protein